MPESLSIVVTAGAAVVAMLVGLAIGFWLAKRVLLSQVEAATQGARAESAAELATARERVRLLEIEGNKLSTELGELQRQSSLWRNDLDLARDEKAKFAERAGRLAVVEQEAETLSQNLREAQARILALSTSEAEKARDLQGTASRRDELAEELSAATRRLSELQSSLGEARAEATGLLADNQRIEPLEARAKALEVERSQLLSQITRLSEDASRVQAELKAEVEAHEATRKATGEERERLVRELEEALAQVRGLAKSESDLRAKQATLTAENDRISPLTERLALIEKEHGDAQKVNASLREDLGRSRAELESAKTSYASLQAETLDVRQRLRKELEGATTRGESLATALSELQSKTVGLETENARIAKLDEQIATLTQDGQRQANLLGSLREGVGRVQAELDAERQAHALVRSEGQQFREQLSTAQADLANARTQLADLSSKLESERTAAQEKLSLLLDAKEALSNQFKTLANDILEEKSKRFAEQNQSSLGQLLDPLKARLQDFQGRVEQFYDAEGKQRSALSQQVLQLLEMNKTLSDEAKNLTSALKGSSKSQGNWGEMILERVLEGSGLRRGEEYDVQESHARDDGTRAQPDVVVHLPEDRHLIIDAKVSLVAYEEYGSSETDVERQAALRRHLDSIRAHIKGLSERNYQALYGLRSLDFVMMFVPIEPAFILGVTQDNRIFVDAWNRNVLLVSPSTLQFVLRTVAHLWRQEAQNRNAQEIAKRGAELYDRLAGFVADLEKVGERLSQAQASYKEAHEKLSTNKGNVIRQAEMLKELGVKPSKSLPRALLEASGIETAVDLRPQLPAPPN